jgi:hypothetical protein
VAIIGGLGVFFAVLGTPSAGRVPQPRTLVLAIVIVLVGGGLLAAAVRGRGSTLRAGVYGGVAGVWFGTVGVLINAAATQFGDHGLAGLLGHASGLVPLIGMAVLGGLGITLTQISFQVGALAASFPANKSADPVAAVVLGAVVLHEHVPDGAVRLVIYLACLTAIVLGAVRLAADAEADPARSGTMGAHG